MASIINLNTSNKEMPYAAYILAIVVVIIIVCFVIHSKHRVHIPNPSTVLLLDEVGAVHVDQDAVLERLNKYIARYNRVQPDSLSVDAQYTLISINNMISNFLLANNTEAIPYLMDIVEQNITLDTTTEARTDIDSTYDVAPDKTLHGTNVTDIKNIYDVVGQNLRLSVEVIRHSIDANLNIVGMIDFNILAKFATGDPLEIKRTTLKALPDTKLHMDMAVLDRGSVEDSLENLRTVKTAGQVSGENLVLLNGNSRAYQQRSQVADLDYSKTLGSGPSDEELLAW